MVVNYYFMSHTDSRPFWLGLIGGLIGIGAALFAISFGSIGGAFDPYGGYELFIGLGFAALLFSITGIIGGVLKNNSTGGVLMILSGILVLISVSFFGIPTLILFLIGGIIKYQNS